MSVTSSTSSRLNAAPERLPAGKLLIVDDEASIRWALRQTLQVMGFEVSEGTSGEQAIALVRTVRYDAVLLDIHMPGMTGVQACQEIRKLAPGLGILMLTVRDTEESKIEALDAGADDYVTKPFNIRELAARIRAAIRRSEATKTAAAAMIRVGDVELDPARRVVRKAGEPIHLTPKEYDLLHYLMAHAGLSLTHARLLTAVWGPEYRGEVEYLRTFVRQLRKKLCDNATRPTYLVTNSHIGYRFNSGDCLPA
ncbi:MAG: response regulator transcription factor [Bryobacteraceae bacterium]|jgi:two-component system KDP operon response regulator KdpE